MKDLKTVEKLIANKFKKGNIYYKTYDYESFENIFYYLLMNLKDKDLFFISLSCNKDKENGELNYQCPKFISLKQNSPWYPTTQSYIKELERFSQIEDKDERDEIKYQIELSLMAESRKTREEIKDLNQDLKELDLLIGAVLQIP